MSKTNYNSQGMTEAVVSTNTTKLQTDARVNNLKTRHFAKWLLGLFFMAFSLATNAQIDVTASGGTASATYTTLRSAFNAINVGTHTGTISISVTSSTTEPGMDSLVSSGSILGASYTSVLIKPASGVSATIGGSIAGLPVIKLIGADNVTIDGSNTLNGTSRDLSIRNSSTAASSCGIWVGAAASNPTNNITVKNCNLSQGGTATTSGSCLFYGSATTYFSSSPAASKNMTISNNLVARSGRGLLVLGASANPDTNLVVSSNTIDSINLSSIFLQAQREFNINDNYFDYKNTTSAATAEGNAMHIVGASANGNILRNNLFRVRHNGTVQTRGISLGSTATSPNITVANNFFGDIWNPGISNAFSVYGIRVDNVTGGVKIYHNTFNFTTALSNNTAVSTCLGVVGTTSASSVDVRNNIFRNVQNGGGNAYAIACLSTGAAAINGGFFSFCDYNSYHSVSPNINIYVTSTGNAQASASSIAAMQSITGKDANSMLVNAQLVSTTDLHLQAVAGNAALNNGGINLGVTTDYDSQVRSSNAPDIGADEIVYTPKITSFSPSSACPGNTVTINGADFTGATAVSLAGLAAASFNVVSTSQITAVVASSSTPSSSAITVTNSSGTATSSTNLDRKSPATFVSKSLATGSIGDQVTITGTNLLGATAVTFNGATAVFSVTNSTEIVATVPSGATTGIIEITGGCGNLVNAGGFTVVVANPCSTPTNQATGFSASSTTSSSLNGTFTVASSNPSGYLVVYSTNALSGAPVDGVTYSAGAGFSGTILQVSSSNNVVITGLTANTAYTVTVFAYNGGGCTGGPLYNTTNPLTYTFTTCSNIPTSIVATPVGNSTGNSINFSWGAPIGGGASSVSYTLELYSDIAMTNLIGSAYNTSSNSQNVSGFNFNTLVYYRIRSNNGCNSAWVTGSVTTACGAGYLPLSQNFDATITSALPTCWSVEDANGDGITWASSNVDSRVFGLSNPRALRYLANTVTTNVAANDWAFMPGVQLTGGVSYTVSFLQNALSNGSEGLQVYYGTSQSSAMKINANKIFDNAALSNTTAVLRTGTFTPATTGTYYLGFLCNSPSNTNGGLFLFLDDITLDVTPAAPAAPAPVTTSNPTPYSIQVNWTDNSSNELGYYVYSSLDNTNWILRSTVGSNVTSAVIGNLKASTGYYFKVEGYNAGGIGTAATTSTLTNTTACSVYTANNYIGTLFTGSGNNWLNTANWSQGRTPNACDDVQINGVLPITSTCFLYLKEPTAIHNLTINQTMAGSAVQTLFFYTQSNSFDISGDVVVSANRTATTTVTTDAVYLVSGPGVMTIDGNVSIGETGNRTSALGSGGASIGPITLKGNVTFGPQSFLNFGNLINFVFDAPSAQTVTLNSAATSASPATYGLGAVTIGAANTPTVTFTDTMVTNSQMSRIVNDFTINNGASVIITNGTSLNRTQSSSGLFSMGSNSSLTISGVTGGVGNSNFPSDFANHSFSNTSTVTYNGTAAQTIAAAPAYGNLILNNTNGATISGNTTVNNVLTLTNGKVSTGANTLTLGLSASLSGVSSSNYINGNLAKTIGSSATSANFEIGDAVNYSPINLNFVGGTTNSGGTIKASTTGGTPAALGFLRSGISQTNYLARKYSLTNSGVTGFTSLTPTFNYDSSDYLITSATSNANFLIADSIYNGGWTLRSATTNPTLTSSTSTGISLANGASADYLLGELDPPPTPTVDEPSPTSACEGSNYVVTGTNFYGVTNVKIGLVNCAYTVNSATQITIVVPTSTPSGVITVTNSGGSASTTGSLTTLDQPITTATNNSQTVCSGVAISTIVLGNSNSVTGTSYSWTRTGNNSQVDGSTSGTTDISGSFVSSSTIPETLTYSINSTGGNGCAGISTTATVVVKASPGAVSLSPSSASICQNSTQQITANYTAATGNQTTNSGVISVAIPDGTGTNGVNGLGGVNTTLSMNSVPAGAVVTKVEVGFSITHTYIGDLGINVQAPNGKILNLAFAAGAEGDNYNNVIISSDADPNSQFLPQDSATTPGGLTGTYAADGLNNVGTPAYRSNTSNYSDLFSTPNGTWRLIARDYGAGDEGNITNWFVKVHYTLQPTFTWTPSAGLFIDAGHNTAYSGGSQQTVYAYNTPGNYSYSANISFDGCTESSTSASVDIQAIATAAIAPSNNETICSGTAITTRTLSSPSDAGATVNWTRDHTSDISGTVGNSGSASISGTLINATSSPITVTFTVTPDGSGSLSCSGTPLTFTVTVNPTPLATAIPLSQSVCSGSAITPINFGTSNSLAGTNYTWTRDNTSAATGIAGSGTQFVSGILTNTGGTTTVTFSITAVGPGASACAGTPTTATVTVLNPATVYAMTGTGGTFCSPGAGFPVGLSNSQAGYYYQLLLNGSPVGSPIEGVDGALSFGNQVQSGTYTIVASSSGCSTTMSGSVVINAVNSVTPTINLITSNTTICGGTNATFFAIATNTGNNPTYNFTVNGNTMQNTNSNFFISSTLSNGDVVRCTLNSTNTCQTASSTPSNELTMTVNSSTALAAPAAITGSTTQCTIGGITYLASATSGGVWSSNNPSVATVVASTGKVTAVSNGTTIISYTVTGSNGCTNSASVVYTVAEVPSLPAITGSNRVCANGGTITLSNATSGGVWSSNNTNVIVNANTGLVTGNTGSATTASYTSVISYKVTNAGCSKTATYNITVAGVPAVPTIAYAPGTPNPQLGAPTGSFCINRTFTIVGSPAGGAWSTTNSNVLTVSSVGLVRTVALGTASLRYTVSNINGCTNSRTLNGTVVNCAARGVNLNDAPKAEFDFNLYPNPAKGSVSFNAEFAEAGGRILLTDMYGKTVKTQMLTLGTNTIDINNLSKGFYLVNIITIDGKKTKKLIVE